MVKYKNTESADVKLKLERYEEDQISPAPYALATEIVIMVFSMFGAVFLAHLGVEQLSQNKNLPLDVVLVPVWMVILMMASPWLKNVKRIQSLIKVNRSAKEEAAKGHNSSRQADWKRALKTSASRIRMSVKMTDKKNTDVEMECHKETDR